MRVGAAVVVASVKINDDGLLLENENVEEGVRQQQAYPQSRLWRLIDTDPEAKYAKEDV